MRHFLNVCLTFCFQPKRVFLCTVPSWKSHLLKFLDQSLSTHTISGNCRETYYLVEAVDSSLQATDFKVKNTFDKKYYFSLHLGLHSHSWALKFVFDQKWQHFWKIRHQSRENCEIDFRDVRENQPKTCFWVCFTFVKKSPFEVFGTVFETSI